MKPTALRHVFGTGYSGPVGQTFENAPNIDWVRSEIGELHPDDQLGDRHEQESFPDRKLRWNPVRGSTASGCRWHPVPEGIRQTHIATGYAWHIDGTGRRPGAAGACRDLSARHLADPARLSESGTEAGRESPGGVALGHLENGRDARRRTEKVHVVGITVLASYRVDATITARTSSRDQDAVTSRRWATSTSSTSRPTSSTRDVEVPIAWHSNHGWRQLAVRLRPHRSHGDGGKFRCPG